MVLYVGKNVKKMWEKLSKISINAKDAIRLAVLCLLGVTLWCMLFIPDIVDHSEEPIHHYMEGIGGVSEGDGTQEIIYSQEFVPEYEKIKTVQILVDQSGIEEKGILRWNITDRNGDSVAEGNIPYEEIAEGRYTDIEVNADVKVLRRYYINISFDNAGAVYPRMVVNSGEEKIWEGKRLFYNGECRENGNFVWGIVYGEVIPYRYKIPVILFPMLALAAFLLRNRWRSATKMVLTGAALLIMPEYVVYYGECVINGLELWMNDMTYHDNYILLYLLGMGLLLITQSPKWALRAGSLTAGALYVADFFVLKFRGSSMKIWDILSAGTAVKVAGNYVYRVSDDILVLFAYLLFIWGISYSFPDLTHKLRYRIMIGCAGIIYSISLYHVITQDEFWNKMEGVFYTTAFDAEVCFRKSGYLASLLAQVRDVGKIRRPEGYVREEVEKILTETGENRRVENESPHIIVIVNESLADLAVLGDVLTEEPLSYMKSLQSNTVKGYVNVSVIGGGTSNSELEFLTGNSMAYLPQGMYPFYIINKRQESLVWDLRDAGYETYAIHPAAAANWNRKAVYPLLGFQNYCWIDEFEGAIKRHSGVADQETYQKIIDIFERRKPEEKQFIYDLTIQNHGGYEKMDVDEVVETPYATVSEYLSLVRYSDGDLKELIEYFEKQDEEVLICIFGDHQPILEDEYYEDIFAGNEENQQENTFRKFKTPFWIWANYDIKEKENVDISLNYLGGLLFEVAELPKSPYMQYISEIEEEYPILTANGFLDKKGIFYTLDELPDKLKEYEKVQYYYMFDNGFDDRH